MKNLLRKILENNILLEVVDGELKMFADKDHNIELIEEIRLRKDELLQYMKTIGESDLTRPRTDVIPAIPVAAFYPLSSSQRRFWVLSQFEEGNVAYNLTGVYIFEGKLSA